MDYCLGPSQSSGEGAKGLGYRNAGTPAHVPSGASYAMSTGWPKRKKHAEKGIYKP